MVRALHFLLATFVFETASVFAFTQHKVGVNRPCEKPISTAAMYECTLKEWQAADSKQKAYYESVLASLRGSDQEKLRAAQQAWESYRKLNCQAQLGLHEGGTSGSYNYNSCMATMAKQRLANLREIYGYWGYGK
jgi:uncharacterized protein YecT (DUF1311 family)